MTHETDLRRALSRALLTAADVAVLRALVQRARWGDGVILDQYQPRSLDDLAELARLSRATCARRLDHLEYHGWVIRHSSPGRRTFYQTAIGSDCDHSGPHCRPERPAPLSGAERVRGYRERRRQQPVPVSPERHASSHGEVTRNLTMRRVPVSPDRYIPRSDGARADGQPYEGQRRGGVSPTCSICGQPLWPRLAALGYTTHPNCDP